MSEVFFTSSSRPRLGRRLRRRLGGRTSVHSQLIALRQATTVSSTAFGRTIEDGGRLSKPL